MIFRGKTQLSGVDFFPRKPLSIPIGFPMVFPMVSLWISHDFPMVFPMDFTEEPLLLPPDVALRPAGFHGTVAAGPSAVRGAGQRCGKRGRGEWRQRCQYELSDLTELRHGKLMDIIVDFPIKDGVIFQYEHKLET